MTIKEKFQALRKESGLKQAQVAELCGASISAVGRWERGERIPFLDQLIELANVYNRSLDIFRQDATTLDIPRPTFDKQQETLKTESQKNDDLSFADIPLRFGSTEPNARQKEILDFCSAYLETLDDAFFIKGAGQNSAYGTGRYFWEKQIDMLLFIGFVPSLEKEHPEYAFSVSVNTETPLPKDAIAEYNALQITDNPLENWLYVPIAADLKKDGALYTKELREATDKALVSAMKIARKLLEITLQKCIALKATANHTKDSRFSM